MRKIQFKCCCGHEEKIHNFDPDSVFFGCTHKFFASLSVANDTPEPLENYSVCRCNEYRPDTLRYVEEAYVHANSKAK
jgi:hypothetical protein